jgi:general secretion pathway protein A
MMQDIVYQNYAENKNTVILIDEAQIIRNQETLEELRLFLNFQLNDKFLMTMVLIGQPQLLHRIRAIPQLEQRLSIKYHLTALDANETEEYIKHRLAVAGVKQEIFTKDAMERIYEYSKGLPRKINNICDMSLLIGFGQELKEINKDLVVKVAADLEREVTFYAEDV